MSPEEGAKKLREDADGLLAIAEYYKKMTPEECSKLDLLELVVALAMIGVSTKNNTAIIIEELAKHVSFKIGREDNTTILDYPLDHPPFDVDFFLGTSEE